MMMQLMIAILLVTLVSAERLTVDVYTESLCPDCIDFIKYSLSEATATEDIEKMVQIRIVPYGNVRRSVDPKTGLWVFDCQHGVAECYGNMIQLCGQKRISEKYAPNDELLQVLFPECVDRRIFKPYTSTRFNEVAILCSRDYGIDSQSVIDCANGEEGYRLHLQAAEETDNLKPAHQYVPWIVGNKKHNETSENLILDSLIQWACENYSGEKIAACDNYQS